MDSEGHDHYSPSLSLPASSIASNCQPSSWYECLFVILGHSPASLRVAVLPRHVSGEKLTLLGAMMAVSVDKQPRLPFPCIGGPVPFQHALHGSSERPPSNWAVVVHCGDLHIKHLYWLFSFPVSLSLFLSSCFLDFCYLHSSLCQALLSG